MRRECRGRFPHDRLQRKPRVSDPGMHHGTCVTHLPWCITGSLKHGVGRNGPGIPGACATRPQFYASGNGPIDDVIWIRDNLLFSDSFKSPKSWLENNIYPEGIPKCGCVAWVWCYNMWPLTTYVNLNVLYSNVQSGLNPRVNTIILYRKWPVVEIIADTVLSRLYTSRSWR